MKWTEVEPILKNNENLKAQALDGSKWNNGDCWVFYQDGTLSFIDGNTKEDGSLIVSSSQSFVSESPDGWEFHGAKRIRNTRLARKVHKNNIIVQEDKYLIVGE